MNDLISRLSELRCQYNCFDENERDAYHTLSEAIKALSDVPDTNVGDTVSRQAVIDVLEERLQANGYSNAALVSELNRSIGYLMRLPSAERHGHWIYTPTNLLGYACSECGKAMCRFNYCPYCGAKME